MTDKEIEDRKTILKLQQLILNLETRVETLEAEVKEVKVSQNILVGIGI